MDQDAFKQFLDNTYSPNLLHARRRAAHHQRIAKGLEWALIILSAITSISLAISPFLKILPITPIIAILSAIVTVIASLMKSLKAHEKFSSYRRLSFSLKKEYSMYSTGIGEYQGLKDKKSVFVQRTMALLSDANQEMPDRTLTESISLSGRINSERSS